MCIAKKWQEGQRNENHSINLTLNYGRSKFRLTRRVAHVSEKHNHVHEEHGCRVYSVGLKVLTLHASVHTIVLSHPYTLLTVSRPFSGAKCPFF